MMKIEELYQLFQQNPIVSTDTRKIVPGCIFFALKGDNFNGNLFASEAVEKGASYAVIDELPVVRNDHFILVDNVLEYLQKLASFHRQHLNIPILAITGTNGKTTTKELVAAVLSKKYKVCFTQGNFNNHIGVPLTLLSMNSETEVGIIEMGANHPGEIDELCAITSPDFGLITNVGKAHLEGFGSFEGVVQTKTEMYRYLKKGGGTCFVNSNDPILINHPDLPQNYTYGESDYDYLQGELASTDFFVVAKALFAKGWLYLKSRLIGDYNLNNILAAACVGKYFNIDPLQIQQAIKEYIPSNNRSQFIETLTNKIVMDAYNANPSSMEVALRNFSRLKQSGKVAILGDMLELGIESDKEHQKIAELAVDCGFSEIFLVGKQFAKVYLNGNEKKFDNAELLADHLIRRPLKDKLILVKGSRGISLEKILAYL